MDKEQLKRCVAEADLIILDIEGTISSIDYVRNVLYPYAEKHLENFIFNNWDEVKPAITLLQNEGIAEGLLDFIDVNSSEKKEINKYKHAAVSYLRDQVKKREAAAGLKMIQGLILANGFNNGDLVCHIYVDVLHALKSWSSARKRIFTYSTGSQIAQKALFQHTSEGCLKEYIDCSFDTTIGSKHIPSSYKFVCDFADVKPNKAIFFSDSPKEIVAAKNCGLKTILVNREASISLISQEKELLGNEDGIITSFLEILS